MDSLRPLTLIALTGAVMSMLLGIATPGHADPRDDKHRIDAEVAKAGAMLESATSRAQEAARGYAAATGAMPAATLRIAEARGRVAAASTEVKSARRQVAATEGELDRANAIVAEAKATVDQAREALGGFVAAAYKGSGVATLNMVVSARGPADLADRLGYLDFVVEEQRDALFRVTEARLTAKEAGNVALLAQRHATEAHTAAAAALASAEIERASAETAAAELAQLAAQREAALAVAAQERAETLARYEEATAQSARIAAELRAWEQRQPAPGPIMRPGARLLMPVQGWKSSDFGMRYDPFYRVWQLHAGMDIAAGGGQPIYAAADGKVTRAGWYGGYGNYTCVYHGTHGGRSLVTCYAHQSRILVDAGQQVRRGQSIGRVGTTGASTGNHLHFEVRIGGTPVNPEGWLPGCLC